MSIFKLWLLITVIPGLSQTSSFLAIFFALAMFVCAAFGIIIRDDLNYSFTPDSKKEKIRNRSHYLFSLSNKFILPFVITLSATAFLPDRNQMLIIAGGYEATNNIQIKQLPDNAAKAINAWLDAITKASKTEDKKTN